MLAFMSSILAAAAVALAIPAGPSARDAGYPVTITSPNGNTTWTHNKQTYISWDTSQVSTTGPLSLTLYNPSQRAPVKIYGKTYDSKLGNVSVTAPSGTPSIHSGYYVILEISGVVQGQSDPFNIV